MPNHRRNTAHRQDLMQPHVAATTGLLRLLAKRDITHVNGCWIVDGKPDSYPTILHEGRQQNAHRLVYEYLHGPLDDNMHVHHECFTPGCVNPSHLVAMTKGDHWHLHLALNRARCH